MPHLKTTGYEATLTDQVWYLKWDLLQLLFISQLSAPRPRIPLRYLGILERRCPTENHGRWHLYRQFLVSIDMAIVSEPEMVSGNFTKFPLDLEQYDGAAQFFLILRKAQRWAKREEGAG